MSIRREFYGKGEDGKLLYKHYSTKGVKLQKLGTDELYDEAIDVEDILYEYMETDIPVTEKIEVKESFPMQSLWAEFLKNV